MTSLVEEMWVLPSQQQQYKIMTEGLGDFFKLIGEEKKEKKEKMKELVGEIDIDSIFSQVKESIVEDKKTAEKVTKQAEAFESWLFSETKQEKEKIEKEVAEVFKEEVEIVEEEPEVEIEEGSLIEKSLGLLSEPSDEKMGDDPITPLDQKFATFDDLQKHYNVFLNRIQQQLSTMGGGGIEDAPKTGGPYVRQYQAWADMGTLDVVKGATGYEFTGAFVDRPTGFEYTQELASSETWKRFGFS